MFFRFLMVSLLAGAAPMCTPVQAAAPKPEAKQLALPNAPFSVQPAQAVIKRYKLVSLLSPLARKDGRHVRDFSQFRQAIVFEGMSRSTRISTSPPSLSRKRRARPSSKP